ncbi:hypothetical protein K2Z84_24090 [Candidatus Binatia bacterium]|nr:hypothetical protein [Candidatus Binatia bacterium]
MVKRTLVWSGLACALALVAGCGGGSGGNNDQGIVFRAGGTFETKTSITSDRITCTEPPTVDGVISDVSGVISLSRTLSYPNTSLDSDGDPCGGRLALINSLTSQSINVQFVTIEYEIPGAAVAVPDGVPNVGIVVPPASCETCTSTGQPGLVYLSLFGQLVSRETMTFLQNNVNRLPATPFQMNLFITASGQSDQGTNYETNAVGYTITVEG